MKIGTPNAICGQQKKFAHSLPAGKCNVVKIVVPNFIFTGSHFVRNEQLN